MATRKVLSDEPHKDAELRAALAKTEANAAVRAWLQWHHGAWAHEDVERFAASRAAVGLLPDLVKVEVR